MNKKIFQLISIAIYINLKGFAIGHYEIIFSSTVQGLKTTYTGLLVYYDDNSKHNRMRVFYNDKNGYQQIIEEAITVKSQSNGVDSFRIFVGRNPSFISDNSESTESYFPDIFYFKKDKNDIYKPDHFESNMGDLGLAKGEIVSFKHLKNFRDEYLDKFLWRPKKEDSVFTASSEYDIPQKIHLILLANTKDDNIGQSCKRNEEQFEHILRSATKLVGNKFEVCKIDGKKFDLKVLNTELKHLKISDNDAIIFYYSGHGFRITNQIDSFPIINFKINNLIDPLNSSNTKTLSSINEELKKKKPKFLLTIAECCNKDIKLRLKEVLVSDPQTTLVADDDQLDIKKIRELFKCKGNIIAATAHPHEFSYYYDSKGGFFWYEFYQVFKDNMGQLETSKITTWVDLIKMASIETNIKAKKTPIGESEIALWSEFEN